MVIIADTSPLNYLILIGHAELLPLLFGGVVVPPAVYDELTRHGAPPVVRDFVLAGVRWLRVSAPVALSSGDPEEEALDDGEREAIALAGSFAAKVLLLLDDGKGRTVAERKGIPVLGTPGVPDLAATKHLIDLNSALDKLLETNFHVSLPLVNRLRIRDAARRGAI